MEILICRIVLTGINIQDLMAAPAMLIKNTHCSSIWFSILDRSIEE